MEFYKKPIVMAAINMANQSQRKRKAGVIKLTKHSTHIDLTPMVDLGFLLITFFIFTTNLSEPKAMDLTMPKDSPITTNTPESGVMTIIPAGNGRVYYYEGKLDKNGANIHKTNFLALRQSIMTKKRNTPEKKLFIIIKPSKSSLYEDVVKVFDEMIVNDIKRYAMADIIDEEETLIGKGLAG